MVRGKSRSLSLGRPVEAPLDVFEGQGGSLHAEPPGHDAAHVAGVEVGVGDFLRKAEKVARDPTRTASPEGGRAHPRGGIVDG